MGIFYSTPRSPLFPVSPPLNDCLLLLSSLHFTCPCSILFLHSSLPPSAAYSPLLPLRGLLALQEFLLSSSPLINSLLSQSLPFLFFSPLPPMSCSPLFSSFTLIWSAYFSFLHTPCLFSSPVFCFFLFSNKSSLPLSVHLLICSPALSFSLIMSVLSGDLLHPKPPTPSPSSSLFLFSSFCWLSFMGTGRRLWWSILSYGLFWCAGTDRDRGWRTGIVGEERWRSGGKTEQRRTGIDQFGQRGTRAHDGADKRRRGRNVWVMALLAVAGFTFWSTLRAMGENELRPN